MPDNDLNAPLEEDLSRPSLPTSNSAPLADNLPRLADITAPPPLQSPPKGPKRLIVGGFVIVLCGLLATIYFAVSASVKPSSQLNGGDQINNQSLSQSALEGIAPKSASGDYTVSGNLRVTGSQSAGDLVLNPKAAPAQPQLGQLYFDQATNQFKYYNGTDFVSLLNGATDITGQIKLGVGIGLAGGQLVNNGVLSLGGQSGNLAVGSGLGFSNGTLVNTGVLGLSSPNGSIGITKASDGNYQLAVANAGPSVTSLDGLSGVLTVANSSGSGSTVTIDNASTAAKGIAQFNATNFSVASGTVNTIQGIATSSSPTFAGLTLSSALTVGNGGTGSTTAGGARTNLGAAALGANSDITSLSGLTTALSVLQGGTGSTTAGGARTNLGAAASGANSDITSLSGLTTALSVLQGGTGATTAGGALTNLGAASNSLAYLTVGNDASLSGERGIAVNATNLSFTDGGANGSYTINTIQGISTSASPTFAGLTLSSALTVGNGGTGSTTAVGARTNLGAAALGANSDITSLSGLTTALSVLQGGTGSTTAGGALTNLGAAANSLAFLTVGNDASLSGERGIAVNATNLSFVDGGANGSYTINTIQGIATTSTPTFGSATLTNASSLTLGQASTSIGSILFKGSGSANTITLQGPTTPSTNTLTLPNETGTVCSTGSVCTGYAPATGGSGYIQNATSVQATANFAIQSAASGSIGGLIKGASGQTADLFEAQDSNGNVLANIDASGNINEIASGPLYKGGAQVFGGTNTDAGGGSAFYSVAVAGRYAYTAGNATATACSATVNSASGCELKVFDITVPGSPTYVGGADASGSTNSGTVSRSMFSIYVSGRYAYVVGEGNSNACSATAGSAEGCELKIFDISVPTSPTYVGGADASGSTNSGAGSSDFKFVTVSGRYAYVTKSADGTTCSQTAGSAIGCELQVYDISNPTSPTYVGGADASGSTNSGTGSNTFTAVTVSGRYAYVTANLNSTACSGTAGSAIGCEFKIFDISAPASPTYKGGADSTGSTNSGTGGTGNDLSVAVSGRYAYIARGASATACSASAGSAIGCELQIYDVINPTSPTYKGGADNTGSTNSGTGTTFNFNGVTVSGRYAYVAKDVDGTACSATAGSASGCEFQIYDVATPSAPTYKGGADYGGATNSGTGANESALGVVVAGRYAYVNFTGGSSFCSQTVSNTNGCELKVFDVTGVEATAINANSLQSSSLQVSDSASVNQLSVGGGLTVGADGIQSGGSVGINGNLTVRSLANGDDLMVLRRFTDSSPTGNFLRLQDATGADLVSISITGNLTVKAVTVNGNLTVNGHFITANASGSTTIAANTAACGTGCTASITGNDTSGVITINTGTGPAAGTLGTVTFANAYGAAPNVVITPNTVPASSTFPQYYYGSGTTTFDLKSYNALSASVTYTFSYHVMQ